MCGTCGCGNSNGPLITEVLDDNKHIHHHGHDHHHHHHGHDHTHEHDHHHHTSEGKTLIELEKDVLHQNQLFAERNRGYFTAKNMVALNMVSSPGSGKTSILEKTLEAINKDVGCYVIEGDQQTLNDAQRIRATNTPVMQVNTGQGCHLESDMVHKALTQLKPQSDSILFIENVGNLVCPAMFDLGETDRIVIMSVTEGDDKPIKYPDAFRHAGICIINKIDLLPYVNFDISQSKKYALQVNPRLRFFEMSATSGEGMEEWISWIKKQVLTDQPT